MFLFQSFKEFTVSLFKRAIKKHCHLDCSEKILYEISLQNQILFCISAVLCKNLKTCTSEMFVVTFVLFHGFVSFASWTYWTFASGCFFFMPLGLYIRSDIGLAWKWYSVLSVKEMFCGSTDSRSFHVSQVAEIAEEQDYHQKAKQCLYQDIMVTEDRRQWSILTLLEQNIVCCITYSSKSNGRCFEMSLSTRRV